jgi:hypothetical protein
MISLLTAYLLSLGGDGLAKSMSEMEIFRQTAIDQFMI